MDEQLSRERAAAQAQNTDAPGSSQDTTEGQAGAKPDPHGSNPVQHSEGKPAANAAESGPDQLTGEGTGARAGEYS